MANVQMFRALGQVDRNSAIYFNDNFVDLHDFRKESDYDDSEVTITRAKEAFDIAVEICKKIRSSFIP